MKNLKFKMSEARNFALENQNGQIIIILLLLMLVGLSIGLAYTQRSITDVTTSTQSEQLGRASSAAEAGIEKALFGPVSNTAITLDNNSTAQIESSGLLPFPGSGAGIEYPPVGRETTAQFWFTDPSATTTPPAASYNATQSTSQFDVYYGNENTTDLPAIEVNVVVFANNTFSNKTYYYDSSATRTSGTNDNNFFQTTLCGSQPLTTSIFGSNRKFFCKQTIPGLPGEPDIKKPGTALPCTTANSCTLILARIRFLYINENHSLALAPVGAGNNLPPQVQIYNSVGTSGQSQKRIQAFSIKDVVPPWFDFALFSVNELRK